MTLTVLNVLTAIIYQFELLFSLKLNVAIAFGTREMARDK